MADVRSNPYPGARPLTADDSALLLGRDPLLWMFADTVRRYPVVEVAGPSGVGKSSLIAAGFVGRLNAQSGLTVRMFSEWSTVPEGSGTAWYAQALAQALRSRASIAPSSADESAQARIDRVLSEGPQPDEDPYGFVNEVQREFGSDLVVVFDQLEELLRDDPLIGRRFLTTVRDVAAQSEDGFTQVVSLREEYLSHLRLIEENLDGALWRLITVGEVSPTIIPDLVSVPLDSAGCGIRADQSLVDALVRAWSLARPEGHREGTWRSFDEAQTGLLHLQAFLYTMYEEMHPGAGDTIAADEVAARMQISWPDQVSEAQDFFAEGLKRYVKLEIDKRGDQLIACDARSADPDPDLARRVVHETKRIAAALPEHLSSAGYKLSRGTDELAATVLTALTDLHRPLSEDLVGEGGGTPVQQNQGNDRNQQVKPIAVALARLCRGGFTDDAAGLHAATVEKYPGLEGWGDDETPAGRMRGETALRTACELVVTYERAIRWLTESSIIRMTPTRKGERIAAVVHDGFGEALRSWASDAMDDPEVEISIPVAITGKQVFFRDTGDDSALTPADLRHVDGLGWIGCNVTAFFDGLVFQNCDFRSTLFRDCRFRDIVFEDCKVDGLLFQGCVFEGGVTMRGTSDGSIAPRLAIKTVTLGRGCEAVGGPVTFENLGGYGIFLDGFTGPWQINNCDIAHVFITGSADGGGAGPGRIVDSVGLRHMVIGGATAGPVVIKGSDAPQYFEAPRVNLVYEDEVSP